ncbi:MAG TPA: hypothetical protein VLN56_00655, partial [Gammaproteobacteria bacterium]|nr:hypothetical protein [Gammaproteobacteria bacterium]
MESFTKPLVNKLETMRVQLADTHGLLLLSFLGLISGVLVAAIIIVFRFLIESGQSGLLPLADPENYEALDWFVRILFTTAGGIILGLLFYIVSRPPLRVG